EPFGAPRVPADLTWLDIVPDATLKSDEKARGAVRGEAEAHGPLTEYSGRQFSYRTAGEKSKVHEVATAGHPGFWSTPEKGDKAVADIAAARAKIHQRHLGKKGSTGWVATSGMDTAFGQEMAKKTPSKSASEEAAAHPDWQEGVDASERYSAWLKTARPTSVKD